MNPTCIISLLFSFRTSFIPNGSVLTHQSLNRVIPRRSTPSGISHHLNYQLNFTLNEFKVPVL